jgi:hypothetical protein
MSERTLAVDSNPGVLMYSHDSYGLGHLRRTLALAKAFVEYDPGLGVLILTGSTVSNTVVTIFLRSWPFVRVASLVVVGILLCFGVFPCWAEVPKPEVSADLKMVESPHLDRVANGYGHAIDRKNLAEFAQEAEASDKLPAKDTLLAALLLVVFFGTAFRWLLAFGRARRRLKLPMLTERCSPYISRRHQRRPVAALLGVFRL